MYKVDDFAIDVQEICELNLHRPKRAGAERASSTKDNVHWSMHTEPIAPTSQAENNERVS